jgi:acetyl esterase
LEWVVQNSAKLGVNPNQIGVGGDSAGGNLAAAVAIKARDTNLVDLAFQMLVYPCTGSDGSLPSAISKADGYGLTSAVMRWYENQYAQEEKFKSHPYAFPASLQDFSGLASAIVVTAEYDTLADDGRIYAERLQEVNALAFFKEYSGAIHGFNALAGVAPQFVNDVQLTLAAEINRCLKRI